MRNLPRIDFIYLIVVIGIICLIVQFDSLTTNSLIIHLALFDVIIGFVLILKGLFKNDMSYVFTGAFCALSAFSSYKDISDSSLFFQVLGGLVGIGNHVRNTFKNTIG